MNTEFAQVPQYDFLYCFGDVSHGRNVGDWELSEKSAGVNRMGKLRRRASAAGARVEEVINFAY